jgi:hypothetical protein
LLAGHSAGQVFGPLLDGIGESALGRRDVAEGRSGA